MLTIRGRVVFHGGIEQPQRQHGHAPLSEPLCGQGPSSPRRLHDDALGDHDVGAACLLPLELLPDPRFPADSRSDFLAMGLQQGHEPFLVLACSPA